MNDLAIRDDFATLTGPDTLTIQRLLPGPIDRVWSYLTDGALRSRWLAGGDMTLAVGAPFTLTWRNDELTDPSGQRPEGFGTEHSMESRITELDPPRRLAFSWNGTSDVSFDLEPRGDKVLLTLVHRNIPARSSRLMIGAGWHAHLDVLAARVGGSAPEPFWDSWVALRDAYDRRLPAE